MNAYDETKDITSYLERETEQAERQFKIGAIAWTVALAVIFGWFTWARHQVANVLTPKAVADVVAVEVNRRLPDMERAIERGVSDIVPAAAQHVFEAITNDGIPHLRRQAEKLFGQYARDVAEAGATRSVDAFTEIVLHNRDRILAAARGGDPASPYAPPVRMDALEKYIAQQVETRLSNTPDETLGHKLDASLTALRNLNKRLVELATNHHATRSQVLAKRLIQSWWGFLSNAGDGHETVIEKAMSRSLQPATPPDEG